jgi:CDGSH-type Zn-finger protein
VFDADRRPWVDPAAADADEIAAVIERCPTGALQYDRHDGGPAEEPPARNTVTVVEDGPLYLRGDIALETPEGEPVLADTRVGLCRCGHSENKPLCDNSHERVFEAAGTPPETAAVVETSGTDDAADEDHQSLTVRLSKDGPFVLDGPYDLRERADDTETRADGALCRCGESAGKPLCDGTHATVGFTTDPGE